jgi:hypothetical protein
VLAWFAAFGVEGAFAKPSARSRRIASIASATVFFVALSILIAGFAGHLSEAKPDDAALPDVRCVTVARDGSFEVRVNKLGDLEDVALTRGGVDVAQIPASAISLERPPLGFLVSAAFLRFREAHLDRKQSYELRVEASGAAGSIEFDPSDPRPQGTGC